MADRIGVCKDCGSKFKIPATFQGTKAKCKKCGGVVEIPAPGAETEVPSKPKPAPAKKPAAKKAKSTPTSQMPVSKDGPDKAPLKAPTQRIKKSSLASRRKGVEGGSKRKKRGGDDTADNKKWIYIIGGGSAVIIIVVCFIIFGGGDEAQVPESVTPAGTDTTAAGAPAGTDAAGATNIPADKVAGDMKPEVKKPEVKKEEPVKKVAEVSKEITPIIDFKPFPIPPMVGCSQERFDELTDCYKNGYLDLTMSAYKRRAPKKTFDKALEEGYDVLPVILNAFNGIDLLNPDDIVTAFNNAKMWNEFTGKGWVDMMFKSGTQPEEMEKNLSDNFKAITSLVTLWLNKYSDNEEKQAYFCSMIEKARDKAASRASKDDE